MPVDDRDKLHRGEHEKTEHEDELEEEQDFADLIGQTVENSRVAGAAASVRAEREQEQEEEKEEIEDLFVELEAHEFSGENKLRAPAPRDISTADEDDENPQAEKPEVPATEDEILAPEVMGQSWLTAIAPPPPPSETAPDQDDDGWASD